MVRNRTPVSTTRVEDTNPLRLRANRSLILRLSSLQNRRHARPRKLANETTGFVDEPLNLVGQRRHNACVAGNRSSYREGVTGPFEEQSLNRHDLRRKVLVLLDFVAVNDDGWKGGN